MCAKEKGAQGVRITALSTTNKVLYAVVAVVQASFDDEVYWRPHRQQILHVLQHTQEEQASGFERRTTSFSNMVQYEKLGQSQKKKDFNHERDRQGGTKTHGVDL